MTSRKEYKWGIIGTGKIAQDFVTALSYLPDARVVAVGSRSQQSADEFAKQYGVARAYAAHDAVADDPEVELIYVSTFHPFHKQGALAALSRGKAVLVEKPLTLNAAEAAELIELARQKNVLLMEAMWTRYLPVAVRIRELLAQKALGDIRGVQGTFGFVGGHIPRLVQPELGGGALLDIGVYPLAFISDIYGGEAPSVISAQGDLNSFGTDENVVINLAYGPGRLAQAYICIASQLANELHIYGTKGSIHIPRPFWSPTTFTLQIDGQSPETFDFPLPATRPGHHFNFINSINLQHEAAYAQRMLSEGRTESAIQPLSESLTIMRTMDEIRRQIGVKYPGEK